MAVAKYFLFNRKCECWLSHFQWTQHATTGYKMKILFILLVSILAINALSDEEITGEWLLFKKQHGRNYRNIAEETLRFDNFRTNLRAIKAHNEKYANGEVTWYKAVNQFTDWSVAEFRNMLKLQKSRRPAVQTNVTIFTLPKTLKAPSSIDWRNNNAVREVKNQGNCGDCWAFSTTGSVEGQFALQWNNPVSLSEQQLLDCSGGYGNGNCDEGGSMNNAMDYIRDNGIMLETNYPYLGYQGYCQYNGNIAGKISGQVHVERMNEAAFVEASGTIGPLSIGINADHIFDYGGGVFDYSGCLNGDGDLNHGVLAVGYGSENGVDYWIVKNSWGPEFGEQGYIRMRRGINLCGIAVDPMYPTL